jgi:hypothetical protein
MTAPLLLLLACTAGPGEETLIEDLRVLALVQEPPEVAPGGASAVEALVVDPEGRAPTVWMWTCTDLGEGCLEAGEEGRPAAPALAGDRARLDVQASPALAALAGEEALPLVSVWALACDPAVCTAPPDEAAMADPRALLATLPIEGVALSGTALWVGAGPDPHQNPVLTPDFDSLPAVAPGEALDLDFLVTRRSDDGAALSLYAYASAGGFALPVSAEVERSPSTRTWYAPEDAAPGEEIDLWVVLVDERAGAAVWQGTVQVE